MATVAMDHRIRREGHKPRPACTACGAPLIDGLGVMEGRLIRNALICSGCDKLGVRCACQRIQ